MGQFELFIQPKKMSTLEMPQRQKSWLSFKRRLEHWLANERWMLVLIALFLGLWLLEFGLLMQWLHWM